MKKISRVPVCVLILLACALVTAGEAQPADWKIDFQFRDYLQIYPFPCQLVSYPVEFPPGKIRANELLLTDLSNGAPQVCAFQLSDSVECDGFLTKATVWFRSDLPIGASRHFCLSHTARTPAAASKVSLEKSEREHEAILAANLLKVRVPFGKLDFSSGPLPPLSQVPAPLLALSRGGAWCGSGTFISGDEPKVKSVEGSLLERGPLFARYQIAYALNNERSYIVTLMLQHDEPHVLVDEQLSGLVEKDAAYFKLDLKAELDPDWREVISAHGYGELSGAITSKLGPDGKQPFELGMYAVAGPLRHSAALYNRNGEDALLVAVDRLDEWETERRQVWSSGGLTSLCFYTREGDTFMSASLQGKRRCWAVGLVARTDLQHKNIIAGGKTPDGGGTEVRLWQKLSSFNLNAIKNWCFDWDEKLDAPAQGPLASKAIDLARMKLSVEVKAQNEKANARLIEALRDKLKANPRFQMIETGSEAVVPSLAIRIAEKKSYVNASFHLDTGNGRAEHWTNTWAVSQKTPEQLAEAILADIDSQGRVITYEHWIDEYGLHSSYPFLSSIVNYFWDDYIGAVSYRGMPAWFGSYARSRATWTKEQREHARAILLFMTETSADDSHQPHHCMVSGHPNFAADVKSTLALACAAFPNHPRAKAWRDEYLQWYDEWLNVYQRQPDPEHNAIGGRWTENIAAYSFTSLNALNLSAQSLLTFDGTDILQRREVCAWVNWYLQAMMSPENGARWIPPEGAHARNSEGNHSENPLFQIARAIEKTAPLLSANMRWLETGGKEGAKPELSSVLIRDYGPVLRNDFGGEHESYLHLMQIAGPHNYRWGEGSDVLYYGSKNRIWSYNLTEDAGDFWHWDAITAFTVQAPATATGDDRDLLAHAGETKTKGLGRHATDQPLYDFGSAQFYRAQSEKPDAVYRSLGMMLVRDDYVILYNHVADPTVAGQFVWSNIHELPNIQQLKPGAAAEDDTITEKGPDRYGNPPRTLKIRRFKGEGSFLTLVSAEPQKAAATPFGALVNDKEYVFCGDKANAFSDAHVRFNGTVGYARAGEVALFEGDTLLLDGFGVHIDGGDFGASAALQGTHIAGFVAGRKGGKLNVVVPADFDAAHASVKFNGETVPAVAKDGAIMIGVTIALKDGTRTFTIDAGK